MLWVELQLGCNIVIELKKASPYTSDLKFCEEIATVSKFSLLS